MPYKMQVTISNRFAALDKLANNTYYEASDALDACYVASWHSPFGLAHGKPRPDWHRVADDSFQDTPVSCWTTFSSIYGLYKMLLNLSSNSCFLNSSL